MKLLDRIRCNVVQRREAGYALPMALVLLVVGGLFVVPSVALMFTSLESNMMVEDADQELYAADAGTEYGLWWCIQPENDGSMPANEGDISTIPFDDEVNDRTVEVTISNEGEDGYKITSIATSDDGDSTTIVSYVDIIQGSSGGFLGDHAAAALGGSAGCDIQLEGNSDVEGDIYANGDICLSGNAEVDGDAFATGEITISNNASVEGEEIEGAPTLEVSEIDTSGYKAEAQAAGCGGYTGHPALPSSGTYVHSEPVHVDGDTDLNISGNATITFEETVCADGDMNISSNATVTFEGPVKIGEDLDISGNAKVIFGGTVYIGGNLIITTNYDVELGGTVYVVGNISMSGNADLVGGETIVADGDIILSGNSNLNESAEDLPFIISTGGDVTFAGNSEVAAIVYAPNGDIMLGGNTDVYGAVVGLTVSGGGNSSIAYAEGAGDREEWPESSGGGDSRVEIRTYTIQ